MRWRRAGPPVYVGRAGGEKDIGGMGFVVIWQLGAQPGLVLAATPVTT